MSKSKQNKRNVVYLCPKLQKDLEEEQECSGWTKSNILRMALLEYLEARKLKRYEQTIAYQKLQKKMGEMK